MNIIADKEGVISLLDVDIVFIFYDRLMLVMVLVGTFYTPYEKRGGLVGLVPQKLKTNY